MHVRVVQLCLTYNAYKKKKCLFVNTVFRERKLWNKDKKKGTVWNGQKGLKREKNGEKRKKGGGREGCACFTQSYSVILKDAATFRLAHRCYDTSPR